MYTNWIVYIETASYMMITKVTALNESFIFKVPFSDTSLI